jgi:hypothetical protein
MGRWSLWIQIPLQILVVVAVALGVAVFMAFSLHGVPGLWVHIAGGAIAGVLSQVALRIWVLNPWYERVALERLLRRAMPGAEHRAMRAEVRRRYNEQPYD